MPAFTKPKEEAEARRFVVHHSGDPGIESLIPLLRSTGIRLASRNVLKPDPVKCGPGEIVTQMNKSLVIVPGNYTRRDLVQRLGCKETDIEELVA